MGVELLTKAEVKAMSKKVWEYPSWNPLIGVGRTGAWDVRRIVKTLRHQQSEIDRLTELLAMYQDEYRTA